MDRIAVPPAVEVIVDSSDTDSKCSIHMLDELTTSYAFCLISEHLDDLAEYRMERVNYPYTPRSSTSNHSSPFSSKIPQPPQETRQLVPRSLPLFLSPSLTSPIGPF